ncbi:MAG: hypothetical protein ACP5OR_09275 [Candidatus Dormibacteria bacterium]
MATRPRALRHLLLIAPTENRDVSSFQGSLLIIAGEQDAASVTQGTGLYHDATSTRNRQ